MFSAATVCMRRSRFLRWPSVHCLQAVRTRGLAAVDTIPPAVERRARDDAHRHEQLLAQLESGGSLEHRSLIRKASARQNTKKCTATLTALSFVTILASSVTSEEIAQLSSEIGSLHKVASLVKSLDGVERQLLDLQGMRSLEKDVEMRQLIDEEVAAWNGRLQGTQRELLDVMLEKTMSEDELSSASGDGAFLEIRAGTGGSEAALFCEQIYEMYSGYCQRVGLQMQELHRTDGPDNYGLREVIAKIVGEEAFARLRYEAGVHRVQRVPETESSGRVHTSTISVAVLPTSLRSTTLNVDVQDSDVHVDTFRASGPGGQHVNKTESAVRLVHRPSGIVVQCQNERSQQKNRRKAMMMLKERLIAIALREEMTRMSSSRRDQLGNVAGERADRIRTYNFSQNRVSDHRVPGLTVTNKLSTVLAGDEALDELLHGVAHHMRRLFIEKAFGNTKS